MIACDGIAGPLSSACRSLVFCPRARQKAFTTLWRVLLAYSLYTPVDRFQRRHATTSSTSRKLAAPLVALNS